MKVLYLAIVLFALSMIGVGCKKLVNVDPPVNKLVTTNVFTNDNTAIATQMAIYTQMQSVSWNLATITGLSSDELKYYALSQAGNDLYANNLNSISDVTALPWATAYNFIYEENAIIENTLPSTGITANTKKLLIGEAEFIRAFWYFYLANLYGDVPLLTTTDYKTNSIVARTAKSKVYTQIVADLVDAGNKLSQNFLDATDTVVSSDRVRPTTWAVSALLARVYLYEGKYDSAVVAASAVINNNTLFGLPALTSVFLKNSQEAIWQIMPPSTQSYAYDGQSFILTKPPTSASSALNNGCALSSQLLNAFEAGDKRITSWISSYTSAGTTWYFPFKYQNNSLKLNNSGEYTMVLRLAEQYLIRAEANAQNNDLSDAINDINTIRRRAGLTILPGTLSQAQVLSAVAHERQVELFVEGHRWLDLKRTNAVDSTMSKVTPLKGGVTWNTDQQLYPLSATDLQNSIYLTQNPGY